MHSPEHAASEIAEKLSPRSRHIVLLMGGGASQNGTTGSDSQRVGYAAGRETNVAQSYKRKEPVDEE